MEFKLSNLKNQLELNKADLNKYYREKINAENKTRLTNSNFTIISSNCNGSMMLNDLGMQFKSPFVNLYVRPKYFVRYLKNIHHYNQCQLNFIHDKQENFPIAFLDDVEIRFLHYSSEEEAAEKWYSRTKRMNLDNYFVIMSERDGCTYQDLLDFDALPILNKVVFTHKHYPDIKSSIYIPGFEDDGEVGVLLDFSGYFGQRHFDAFDYISWFNGVSIDTLKQQTLTRQNRHVVGIRTHQWTSLEESLYKKLLAYFQPDEILVVVDETKNTVQTPSVIKKIPLNTELMNRLGILAKHPNPKGLGWLCGDYFYYALADAINAQYYWLIEPDVDFTFANIGDFFSKYENEDCDALLHNFGPASDSWAWTKRAYQIHDTAYQAFFPLSRLSTQAIQSCLIERKRLTKDFLANNTDLYMYPNDESLVATSVVKHGLRAMRLNRPEFDYFQHFSYQNSIVAPSGVAYFLQENQVIHPARSPEKFARLLADDVNTVIANSSTLQACINRSYFHKDDIATIVNFLHQGIGKQLQKMLEQKAQADYLRHFSYQLLAKKAYQLSAEISYKAWVWKNIVSVLDAHIADSVHSLEYIIQDNKLICNVFTRRGDDGFLVSLAIQQKHPYKNNGDKVCLMTSSLDANDLESKIEDLLEFFIKEINNYYQQR